VASLVEGGLQSSNSSRLVTPETVLAEHSAVASLSYASFEDEYRGLFSEQQVSLEHEAERLQQLVQQLAQCRCIADKVWCMGTSPLGCHITMTDSYLPSWCSYLAPTASSGC
jgi:hypothetical protein